MGYFIVFLGAGIGGVVRHGFNLGATRLLGAAFPFGTLGVNVAGSFAMAIIAEFFALRSGLAQEWRLFLTTGLLGGFTTFSAFSLDTLVLWRRGDLLPAVGYVAASMLLSLSAFVVGLWFVRLLVRQ